jgi:hypothetical protein
VEPILELFAKEQRGGGSGSVMNNLVVTTLSLLRILSKKNKRLLKIENFYYCPLFRETSP